MDKSRLNGLFANLCCSQCKVDFDEDSIKLLREDDSFVVVQVACPNCSKSFGIAFLGVSSFDVKKNKASSEEDLALNLQDGPLPISSDDVIDAHNFIKNIDADWKKFIPQDFIKY